LPITVRSNRGVTGESVLTAMFFVNVLPPYPLVLTLMVIFPSPPGGICLVYETAAHPHPVLTVSIFNGAVPLFCTIKSCVISVPSKTGPNLYRVSGTKTGGTLRVFFSVPKEPF
jgi:TRAP-type mannitol/chloroaromatic compound transport system permease large subunit